MDKKLKKQIYFCTAFYFIFFGALMITGTFFDLEIDKALFNYQNTFGVFMENFGMYPMFILPVLAYSTLIASYHPIDDAFDIAQSLFPFFSYLRKNRITYYFCFVLLHLLYAFFIYKAFQSSNDFLNIFMGGIFGYNLQDLLVNAGWTKGLAIFMWTLLRIAFVLVFVFFFRRVAEKYKKALEFTAVAGLALYYGGDLINYIKAYFHRIRFREMIAYSHGLINSDGWTSRGNADIPRQWIESTDFSAFNRWYRVGNDMGVYSEPTSFPSGHTSAAAFTMLLALLFSKCRALNKYFVLAFSVGFIYTLSMGISRLIRGAHYLTDISAGAIIIFAMMLLIVEIMNIIERKAKLNVNF